MAEFIAKFREVFVIQETGTGLFLAENLSWVQSFKSAGRLYSRDEAMDTAVWNSDVGGWEIHRFFERVVL